MKNLYGLIIEDTQHSSQNNLPYIELFEWLISPHLMKYEGTKFVSEGTHMENGCMPILQILTKHRPFT
jgi:hypothetical protein